MESALAACLADARESLDTLPHVKYQEEFYRILAASEALMKWQRVRSRVSLSADRNSVQFKEIATAQSERTALKQRLTKATDDESSAVQTVVQTGNNVVSAISTTPPPSGQPGAKTDNASATFLIPFSSRHYGAPNGTSPDFALVGEVGIQPTLNVLSFQQGQSTLFTTGFQTAWVFKAGGEFNWKPAHDTEITAAAHLAGTGLTDANASQVVTLNNVQTVAFNATGNGTTSIDGSLSVKLFDKDVDVLRAQNSLLSPQLEFEAGLKRDGRFSAIANGAGYDASPVRWFFLLDVTLRVAVPKTAGGQETPYTLRVRISRDSGFSPTSVPAGTQIVVTGDIDALKAFGKS